MLNVLMHEGTYRRIADRLVAFGDAIRPIILRNDGQFEAIGEGVLAAPARLDVGYGTPDVWFTPLASLFVETLLKADTLDWFQSSAAGTEHPILQAIGGKAEIYTSSHAQSDAIAEWVLWVGLDWFQRGGDRRAAQVRKDWKRIEFTEIGDTHWLIVGFGAIGRASAKRLRALGAHVTGVRRTVGPDPNADVMVQPNDLHDCLPAADAVLLCCPLTEETEEMANHDFFQAMKPGAFFANVGRGKLVDEAALLSALDTGQIAHAALDVVAVEPLPENNPIWSHPRITLTSHLAADTMGAARRTDDIFLSNLERFVAQQPLMGVVARSEFAVSPN